MKYQIVELGLQDNIIVVNHVPFDEVQRLIKKSDVLLLPSTEEGIANVVLEAMAGQKLVLTTNCGGMEEVVVDEKNGFMVPIRNTHELSKKIIHISKLTESLKKEITSNALSTIKKQHSNDLMVNGMFELYQSI